MTGHPSALARECQVFTALLAGRPADDYVFAKYTEAHQNCPALSDGQRFDGFLIAFARRNGFFARLADAHARIFAPRSLLRRKLVLLLAILETCPPYHRLVGEVEAAHPAWVGLAIVWSVATAVLRLLMAAVLFLPVQAVLGLIERER
jgi:hypothetical protein